MVQPKRRGFDGRSLRKIADAKEFQDEREPSLGIGSLARLNSGGPIMIVVDIDGQNITVAWRSADGVEEHTWARPCLHRVRDAW